MISCDVDSFVEDADDIYVSIVSKKIGNAVVAVEDYPHMPLSPLVAVVDLRKRFENLNAVIEALNCARRR